MMKIGLIAGTPKSEISDMEISRQAAKGKGLAEASTTRLVTPKNNPVHECPTTF